MTLTLVLCGRCCEWVELHALLAHLEHEHGVVEQLDEWPDGGLEVVDDTLTPADFREAS